MTPVALRTLCCTLPLLVFAAAPLFADVTVRYQSTINAGPAAPPQVKQQMEKFHDAWGQYALRMKNGKQWSNAGRWTFIVDCTNQQMTLLDTVNHTLSHLTVAEFPDKMAAMMPKMSDEVKQSMPTVKSTVDSRKTGRMDTILGMQAEERETVISMEMSMRLPSGEQRPLMTMKMVLQIWNAKPEESLRNQAIREMTGYKLWNNYFMNPATMMEKMMAAMPQGNGDFVKAIAEGAGNNAVMLRTRNAIYMTLPPEAQKMLTEQHTSAGGVDPNAPMFEMTQEAVEVSSAPVEESLFRIPTDYREIPADEFLKSLMQSQMAAMGAPQKPGAQKQ